jgi:hypothetical protein
MWERTRDGKGNGFRERLVNGKGDQQDLSIYSNLCEEAALFGHQYSVTGQSAFSQAIFTYFVPAETLPYIVQLYCIDAHAVPLPACICLFFFLTPVHYLMIHRNQTRRDEKSSGENEKALSLPVEFIASSRERKEKTSKRT